MLGPLTTSWIQKHHQEDAKTLARSPPYPAKDRDKLEESFESSKELRLNFIQMHPPCIIIHPRGSKRAYISPSQYKTSAYNSK